jgi:HB1, ASXL, restriction endonuclease HTH domain
MARTTHKSFFEAALSVLEREGKPLTTREVVQLAIRRGLIEPKGKTPEATMSAELYKHLGIDSRLVKQATPGKRRAVRGTVRWTIRSR